MITKSIKLSVRTSGASDFEPTLDCFIPDNYTSGKQRIKKAIVVCPGGGYHFCAKWEGEAYALKFAAEGYAAFVLNYSVAPATFPQSVCEAAEAVKIVRENAESWDIDPNKIIICGSSAGGHLAASLGVMYNNELVLNTVKCGAEQCKPNAMLLCYPVITSGDKAHKGSFKNLLGADFSEEKAEKLSIEKLVAKDTPPAFIWSTFTDETVPIENSLMLATALKEHDVNTELHIFPHGNHGLALSNDVTGTTHPETFAWIELALRWLSNI